MLLLAFLLPFPATFPFSYQDDSSLPSDQTGQADISALGMGQTAWRQQQPWAAWTLAGGTGGSGQQHLL